ncbi:uncharacterized protein F4822DRAFT_444830 [Hypoxylon trugodes]|uniref:uncharacterized protein n=1 Tax=Hypoxylon trugodes TaxID=326681 RepID=UPI0021A0F691|nr:uncharacterized protein F4822DRAFT_444830 [Hypoxylon trugodes]KAI1386430.1 hypothetical protein F4822DRAFT_444830 [Hypoxylon trugodes]
MTHDSGVTTRPATMPPPEASSSSSQVAAHLANTHDGINSNGGQNHPMADTGMNAMLSQFSGLGINAIAPMPPMIPMTTADGRPVAFLPNYPVPSQGIMPPGMPLGYAPAQADAYSGTYLSHGAYQHPLYTFAPYGQARAGVAHERTETSNRELPGLDIRRSSYSTNESTPATPFLGSMSREHGPRVTVFDRSSYTTPSPQQLVSSEAMQEAKSALLDRSPKIPRAIEAIYTPEQNMKTLEQSLVNPLPGNRNVYIRGLHPNTDDALLLKYAERFGRVETSKAIIDSKTGACKGFGFAKFYDVRDSQNCIRGFYQRGYEVGFARESFNSRLQAEGDPQSTNLYLSNLPRSWRETELLAMFEGLTVLSSKVLTEAGTENSRGVGFARFENHEICEHVIKQFSGLILGVERLPLQIRYADTAAQRELKRVTAKRRQWRTNEYNASAYGTTQVGMNPAHSFNYRYNAGSHRASHQGDSRASGDSSSFAPGHDDGVEIRVESPLIAHGSNQSSPVKQEKE